MTSCTGKTISLNILSDTYRFIQGTEVISLYKVSKESYTHLGHKARKGFWEPDQQIIINNISILTYSLKNIYTTSLSFKLFLIFRYVF